MADSLCDFLKTDSRRERTLAVVGDVEGPIQSLFEESFGGLDVGIESSELLDSKEATVALVEDGEVAATSPMAAIRDAILLVNSDLYTSGLSGIDKHEAPEVLTELDEQVVTLRGFPASVKEKLLLIVISRYIERQALEAGGGRLDVAFQRLSRLCDEYGTKKVYERLATTAVDVHTYGVPDRRPTDIPELTVHGGDSERYRRSWFVVFTPPPEGDTEPAALVAVETGENVWRSMWTYDAEQVAAIQQHIQEAF